MTDLVIDKEAFVRRIRKLYSFWKVIMCGGSKNRNSRNAVASRPTAGRLVGVVVITEGYRRMPKDTESYRRLPKAGLKI